jgi:uncharacterized membrane protein YhaH (DUF805 family)
MHWYVDVIKKYAVFEGRARRTEYWMFFLVNVVIAIVLAIIDTAVGLRSGMGVGLLGTLYSLAVLLPGLAVGVRRLHDTARSGWWLLLALIPLVGPIVLLVFMATDGTPGANSYGPNPKEVPAY